MLDIMADVSCFVYGYSTVDLYRTVRLITHDHVVDFISTSRVDRRVRRETRDSLSD
jgi:SHS2 domain-containing protein